MTCLNVLSSRSVSELYKVEVVFLSLLESVLPTCLNPTISKEKVRTTTSSLGLRSIKSVWIRLAKLLFGCVIARTFYSCFYSLHCICYSPAYVFTHLFQLGCRTLLEGLYSVQQVHLLRCTVIQTF